MRKMLFILLLALLAIPAISVAASGDGFDDLVTRINARASLDLGAFRVKVGAEFGIGEPRIDAAIKAAGSAGEAYMCFQIGQKAQKPPEEVIKIYTANKKKGWGYIAKQMGIKPGSQEFHDLKNGKYVQEELKDGPKSHGGETKTGGSQAPQKQQRGEKSKGSDGKGK